MHCALCRDADNIDKAECICRERGVFSIYEDSSDLGVQDFLAGNKEVGRGRL
jgi:hypothetical protein